MMLRVILRKPRIGEFSFESVFLPIFDQLRSRPDVDVRISVAPFESRGLLRRLAIIIWAACLSGDVVHVTGDIHYATFLTGKRRTILTVHDVAALFRLPFFKSFVFRLFWLHIPFRSVKVVTAVSPSTMSDIQPAMPRSLLRYIVPNGVEAPCGSNSKLNWQNNLLAVGAAANKNLGLIVRALEGSSYHLKIVGQPSPLILNEASRLGVSLEFVTGLSKAEVQREYLDADAVVFVSNYEGFGMPVIEAQRLGRPVIASDIEPIRWVAGRGAILVPTDDPFPLRSALDCLRDNEASRRSIIDAGFANVVRFQVVNNTELYLHIYRSVIQHKK